MLKYFATIFFMCVFVYASAQQNPIDSLRNILPSLKDTARINCLHQLSIQYLFGQNRDSTTYYVNLVSKESREIHYNHGLAVASWEKAAIAYYFHNTNNKEIEQLAKESLEYFNQTPEKKEIYAAYWWLGRSQMLQCNYDKALINLKLAYQWAKRDNNDHFWTGPCLEAMTDIYRDRGEYINLLQTQRKLIQADRKSGDTGYYSFHELWVLGLMYKLMGEYSTALPFWRHLFFEEMHGFGSTWNQMEYAELLTYANQPDSTLYYYNEFDSAKAEIRDMRYFLVSKGEFYLYLKQYKNALSYFRKGLIYHNQLGDLIQIKRTLLDIAKAFNALGENDSAINFARQGIRIALTAQSLPTLRDGYEVLHSVYDRLHQIDSAYKYYSKYISIQEAVMNNQTLGKVAAYGYEHKIELLNNEKQIGQEQLKSESSQKNILIAGMAFVVLLSVIILRNFTLKRKNEKLEIIRRQAEFQQQATELEMQSLRSQMNPHFIFNCLSSINSFILKSKTDEASKYLTKFSRLIRMVLNNSKQSFISLEDELETLRLYLDMERLRFKNSFDYAFNLSDNVEMEDIFIPPLLLQPFAENAIWHGLMHKQQKGFLIFDFSVEEKFLICNITDNGVGREQAELLKSKSSEKQKSMGLKITTERLILWNNQIGKQTFFTIEDLKDENGNVSGTGVYLKIGYKTLNQV